MMRPILIIEDDTDINNVMREALTKAGYSCVQAFSGTEGVLRAESDRFSVIILDLMLPGMHGEEVLKKLHGGNAKASVPVMVVSAKDSLESKVDLLTAGAEDYMTKPFEVKEFVARIGVLMRRAGDAGDEGEHDFLTYGEITLNRTGFTACVNESPLDLTKHEFRILELLMMRPDKVFSKQEIYDYAWEDYYIGEDKTVNVHISNIRKKIKAETEKEYIETVWGIGFKIAK